MNKEELQVFMRRYHEPQLLNSVGLGQKVVWVCKPRFTSLEIFVETEVARSTKKFLFLQPDEQMRRRLEMRDGEMIRFDRRGYRKDSHDRLYLPHKGLTHLAYSNALHYATKQVYHGRIHLASDAQVLDLLSFLQSFPQSHDYYLPDPEHIRQEAR